MIEFTTEQQELIDLLMSQVDNPNGRNVIVSGSGGTGKTTIICEMVYQLNEMGKKVAVTAMTGKATAVLRGKIELAFEEHGKALPGTEMLVMETVAKITKKSSVVGISGEGDTLFSNSWRDPADFEYDVLFVDELSMVPQYFVQWWKKTPCLVFGFGDECQLPEIGGEDSEKEFRSFKNKFGNAADQKQKWVTGYGTMLLSKWAKGQLHKVLRSDNDIALLCGDLRKTWMTKQEYVDTIKNWATKTNCITYSKDLKDANVDNTWQIICFTNKMCQRLNNHFAKGGDYPSLQDKIIVEDNVNPVHIYNGDTMTFSEFREAVQTYNQERLIAGKKPIAVCVKWQGQMPNIHSRNSIEREYASTYAYYKNQFKHIQERRTKHLPQTLEKVLTESTCKIDKETGAKLLARVQRIIVTSAQTPEKTFQHVIDLLMNTDFTLGLTVMERSEELPKLYMVNMDYGYAITTHKSQGSEYEKVCYLMEKFNRPLLYTGLSRAKKEVRVIDLT